jgi:hypothetical protein
VITAGSIDSGSAPFKITRSARDPEESQLVDEKQTTRLIPANPISLLGLFTRQGVGVGDGLLAEEDGEIEELAVGVACGVAVGDACGVAVGLLVTVADAEALGETEATGLDEATADAVALGKGLAFLASLSRTPARRSMLCLAVRKVSSKVTPKKIAPR